MAGFGFGLIRFLRFFFLIIIHKGSDNNNVRETDDNDIWPPGWAYSIKFIFWTRELYFFFMRG